jgi:hypothetical protein
MIQRREPKYVMPAWPYSLGAETRMWPATRGEGKFGPTHQRLEWELVSASSTNQRESLDRCQDTIERLREPTSAARRFARTRRRASSPQLAVSDGGPQCTKL